MTALVLGGKSGFNIIFGGFKDKYSTYSYKDAIGQYWTSDNENYDSWAIEFANNPHFMWRHIKYAISVRCLKE